jgi:hypothetical protein
MFTMGTWSKDELEQIATNDDLHISPFREDGVTYGKPTWIWSVAVGEELFVRLQRTEVSLVSGRDTSKGGPNHSSRDDEGSGLRTGHKI